MTALDRAIAAVGGKQTELAQAVGVSAQAVGQWVARNRPIPADRCALIERATGVRCEELRPDVVWTRNEQGQVTGYHVRLAAQGNPEAA